MSQSVIARRYAKALLALAPEASREIVSQELEDFADAYNGSEDLRESLSSSRVSGAAKEKVLVAVMEKLGTGAQVQTFLRFLLSKRRILLAPDIATAFDALVKASMGKVEAEVTVAQEPSTELVQSLQSQLSQTSGKEVSVTIKIDPSIIGGVVTRIGSTVIDGSLRNQLNRVRQSIIQG